MGVNSFLEKYEQISSTEDFRGKFIHAEIKTCKFCGLNSSQVSFKNIPHVIPELFGKNNFTSNEECDHCNAKFGIFETDLSNFISPYLTLTSQKTKRKIPQFQSRKDAGKNSTTIKNVDGRLNMNFGANLEDFKYDYQNNLVDFRFKKKKFIPINVYKGLVHVALSLCPEQEIRHFQDTIDWILERESNDSRLLDVPLFAFRTRFSNKKFNHPSAHLFRRKNEADRNKYAPKLSLVIYSGMLVFQIFLPGCSETRNFEKGSYHLELDIFPAFLLDLNLPENFKEVTIKMNQLPVVQYDLNFDQMVEEDELLTGKYSSIDRK